MKTPPTTRPETSLFSAESVTCEQTEGSNSSVASPSKTNLKPWPPAGVKPYYSDDSVCIILGDCREILPTLEPVDLVLTDPPYPNGCKGNLGETDFAMLSALPCRQFIFWSETELFPLAFTARHKWKKPNGFGGRGFETIFERNGKALSWEKSFSSINSPLAAQMTRDTYTKHPAQKPAALMRFIIDYAGGRSVIVDPYLGSGTTLRAAKDLGRKAVGIEIEEKYCEISAKRMSQEVLKLD